MTAFISTASKDQIYELIDFYGKDKFDASQISFFHKCVSFAANVWVGFIDKEVVCFWGLIPPSFLIDQAYLWLYTTPALIGNEFVFVRQSQIAVRAMLKLYTSIVGHTEITNTSGIRWLRWLGAEFAEPQGQLLPFVIRRKDD